MMKSVQDPGEDSVPLGLILANLPRIVTMTSFGGGSRHRLRIFFFLHLHQFSLYHLLTVSIIPTLLTNVQLLWLGISISALIHLVYPI
jgi:hypothetical protein